jgi:pimeloyl-ACP methyl ester carboxylesterase
VSQQVTERVEFESHGVTLVGQWFRGEGDTFATGTDSHGQAGARPCVLIAHGFGNTADSGLQQFGEAFSGTGLDAIVFDYRCFGASAGEPRQLVSYKRHREDYHSAIAFARSLPGVDPERIVLWGTSYSGGHVIAVAAEDHRIAAVISVVASLDGAATLRQLVKTAGAGQLAKATARGMQDRLAALAGREPVMMATAAVPGELAALSTPDALSGVLEIAGPTYVNEFCAREALVASNNRPIKVVDKVRCPVLFQIAVDDQIAPNASVEKAAEKLGAQAELRRYPGGHFDAYRGDTCAEIKADEIAFLQRILAS